MLKFYWSCLIHIYSREFSLFFLLISKCDSKHVNWDNFVFWLIWSNICLEIWKQIPSHIKQLELNLKKNDEYVKIWVYCA